MIFTIGDPLVHKTDYTKDSYLNAHDMQRITSNYNYCATLAESCGYKNFDREAKIWEMSTIPFYLDVVRLVRLIRALSRELLGSHSVHIQVWLHWYHVNSWEYGLKKIEDFLVRLVEQVPYSGMCTSGSYSPFGV